ncbi:MAG TPA: IS256 family transposase [Draconibacterium sp.]|jgi:putative transposase|nr:IS256 family transposase [Draconibacterium sp.]
MEKKESKKRENRKRLNEIIPDDAIRNEMLSRLYKGDPILGENGVFTNLLQSFVNAALEGEMDNFLQEAKDDSTDNRRNGHTSKSLRSTAGPLSIQTPRDRAGDHEPVIVKKRERELSTGLDEIILSLYARGQSVEDVRFQLHQIYGLEVSAGAISAVTDRVWSEIIEWQQRPLATCYTIIYLDAIHYKVREDGKVISKAIYTVYSVTIDGQRDILGLYLSQSEGARQWGLILEDIKRRGVEDVLFFSVDGLTGFKDVIEQSFPCSAVQRCIVHKIRNSTRYVSDKDIKAVCRDLRKIYTASDRDQALIALEAFGEQWNAKYKEIKPSWEADWDDLMAFMDYGENIRRMIYTTNPVEAVHRVMRKVTKTKGAWSNDKGLLKQLYLTLKYNEKSWKRTAFNWKVIQRELMEHYGERYTRYLT